MAPAVHVQSQALCSPAPGANSVSLSTRQSRRETSLWLLMGSTLECLMALRFISRFIVRHPCCLVQLRCPVSPASQSCLSRALLSSHAGAAQASLLQASTGSVYVKLSVTPQPPLLSSPLSLLPPSLTYFYSINFLSVSTIMLHFSPKRT